MSFPRLTLLVLPLALGLPLLTAACGAPLAVSAASYGADGASVVETGKTGADHLVSMVSKKDCALWRVFRNQNVCHPYDGNQNPYDVNYNAPFRQGGEGGVEYMQPPHAATDAPVQSWDADAYDAVPTMPANVPSDRAAPTASAPAPAQAAALTPDGPAKSPTALPAKVEKKHPVKGHSAARHKPLRKKPSQDRAASVP